MNDLLIRLLGGVIGTFGFECFFEVKLNRIPASMLGGIVGTFVYLVCIRGGMHEFVANTIAAFLITLYSETVARILHSPVPTFQIPGLIVLVPGRTLYYTMSNLISGNFAAGGQFAVTALQVGAGIADGIICGTVLFGLIELVVKKANSAIHAKQEKRRCRKIK